MFFALRELPASLEIIHNLLSIVYNKQWVKITGTVKSPAHEKNIIFVILRQKNRDLVQHDLNYFTREILTATILILVFHTCSRKTFSSKDRLINLEPHTIV